MSCAEYLHEIGIEPSVLSNSHLIDTLNVFCIIILYCEISLPKYLFLLLNLLLFCYHHSIVVHTYVHILLRSIFARDKLPCKSHCFYYYTKST